MGQGDPGGQHQAGVTRVREGQRIAALDAEVDAVAAPDQSPGCPVLQQRPTARS